MLGWLKQWALLRVLKEVLDMGALKGYKTYIAIVAILVLNALEQAGILDPNVSGPLKDWLYPIAIAFLRAGVPDKV